MALFRKTKKLTINDPDPEFNVVYLGNVLTVLAKGEGCLDKPLSLIWRAYNERTRHSDLPMKLRVTKSGLHASIKDGHRVRQQVHGSAGTTSAILSTEYWAHRITYCTASSEYPRLFAWVYKHDGTRPMKPELRCHVVLCKKVEQAQALAQALTDTVATALQDYKREKISRQNTRLSARLPGIGVIVPLPLRKQLLLSKNFRPPPLDRSRSSSRLDSIDESEEILAELSGEMSENEIRKRVLAFRLSEPISDGRRRAALDSGNSSPIPGTPMEIKFGVRLSKTNLNYYRNLYEESGAEKLSENGDLKKSERNNKDDTADGSISDESGFGDEKASSLEDYDLSSDSFDAADEELICEITSF